MAKKSDRPDMWSKDRAIELWANGASDHLYEIEVPEGDDWKEIAFMVEELKELGLEMGHGFGRKGNCCTTANAERLLDAVGRLETMASADGVEFPDNPVTGSGGSGATYGGFRPQDCTQGALHSSHKEALAVDRFDPKDKIDEWCMKNLDAVRACGIYIEHPSATQGWSHWTVRAPRSGKTVFMP